jgi:hypothetical protein
VSNIAARWMSAELADKWAHLTEQQARAIERIVLYGHLTEHPFVPYALLQGPDPVASEMTIYSRWAKQPQFVDALRHTQRLARMQEAEALLERSEHARRITVTELAAINQAELDLIMDPAVDADVRRKAIVQARAYRDPRQYEADIARRRGSDEAPAATDATANWLEAARRS